MSDDPKINAIVNIGQLKIIEKVYDDILREPSKSFSHALGTILGVGNSILWPLKYVNEITNIYFQNNIKKYEEKLKTIDEFKIIPVPSEIAMPIIERFCYVSNEDISNAFVALLASSSSIDSINKAHPSFIQIIDRITPDEAKILIFLSKKEAIAVLDVKKYFTDTDGKVETSFEFVIQNKTVLNLELALTFPENINIYLKNIESLGLIEECSYYYLSLNDEFTKIETSLISEINNAFEGVEEELKNRIKEVDKKMFKKTEYGQMFIEACISNP